MAATQSPSHAGVLPSPGARVVIRDAEWVVRRVDNASDGGWQLTCDGISEVVRGRTALFLTQLEDGVQVLDPAATEFVADDSPRYTASLLHIESVLRSQVPNDGRLYIGHRGAMDRVPYQLDPALQALRQHRQRILIADAVGLGKTLEAGILVAELIQRGRGNRILVVTLKSMLTQFQKEFWNRFTIPLVRLDSVGLARVRARIPSNHNPFYYYDKTIISMDTLKGDLEYRNYLENAWWDLIVIDECHNVADRGTSGTTSQRARLAKLLASRSDTLIMLSATPHDGRARSFASLVNMLDPTAISDPDEYRAEDFRDKGLVIRRFKKDIQAQVRSAFKDRLVRSERHAASPAEEAAYAALLSIPFTLGGEHAGGKRAELVRIGLQKALFSSPAAARQSVAARIRVLESGAITPDVENEIAGLRTLDAALAGIQPERYGKYQRLLTLLKEPGYGWSPTAGADRLVIFSERIETLRFLQERLQADLGLPDRAVAVLHGGLPDTEQQELVENFGKTESPLQVLLCSDVAAEGLNLHYLSHRLIHFDLPWSLMVFQQRNGRVDRYGQNATPIIAYLITESVHPRIRGDLRILEVLQQKDEQAYRNIGDPSVFMRVYDAAAEERLTEAAMAEGMSAETFDATYQPEPDEGEDFLSLFMTAPEESAAPVPNSLEAIAQLPGLFASDFAFCQAALEILSRETPLQWQADANARRIVLTAPPDLQVRLRQLPRELWPEHGRFVLTDDPAQIQREVARCRQDETAWPKLHYLWPLHVVMDWLNDRLRAAFGRHRAPVLRTLQLAASEVAVLIAGTLPNRKGQPLVMHWLAVCCREGQPVRLEDLAAFLDRLELGRTSLVNTGAPPDLERLQRLLPEAVAAARTDIVRRRDDFDRELQAQLARQRAELARLQARQFEQLELQLTRSEQAQTIKEHRRATRTREIRRVFEEYQQWIQDTLTTERDPWLHVIAAVVGGTG